ncbi:exodeoxyribonuclease VII small subunit [Calycomorphotria hydatis]|uniref:Exodeoxyribonuclease 7 small subunit n=1 Tax=Calycomorphotria hydatis TaxID=2528027 RepID=A0A517TCN6_9PLAN|nr:Exodeoxyribonuclease 7 small subunit [Calycomorphotria hydatis]
MPDEATPTFEEALSEIEQIVRELDDGRLGLDESLSKYETGIKLLRQCYQTLEQAEERIEILTGWAEDGTAEVEPFDATATAAQSEKKAGRRKVAKKKPARKKDKEEESDGDHSESLF